MDRTPFLNERARAYAAEDYAAARAFESRRISAAPEDWDAWMRASYTEARLDNWDAAAQLIETAVRGAPSNAAFRKLLREYLTRAGRASEIASLERDLGGSPKAVYHKETAAIARTAKTRLADTLARILPFWPSAADRDPAPRFAHWLSDLPGDEHPLWAAHTPIINSEGDAVDFGDYGRLRCGPVNQVIHKRIARGIPWELPVATLLAELAARINPDHLVLDIGANAGTLTVPLARHSAGPVLAFEPVPSTHLALIDNLALNRLGNVETRAEALSTRPGHAAMFDVRADNSGTAKLASTTSAGIPVPLARLDDILDGRRVGLIKIDVEGHEIPALQGGLGMLERDRPLVVAEVLGANRDQLLGFFDALGYAHTPIMREDNLFYPKT